MSTSILERHTNSNGSLLSLVSHFQRRSSDELCNDFTLGSISHDFFATRSLIQKHKFSLRQYIPDSLAKSIIMSTRLSADGSLNLSSHLNTCLLRFSSHNELIFSWGRLLALSIILGQKKIYLNFDITHALVVPLHLYNAFESVHLYNVLVSKYCWLGQKW
jgi:hypothetical protein